jgi:NAD(P)-dependent dehydrogenase (short-subunit alcohol dehydrogenase family)
MKRARCLVFGGSGALGRVVCEALAAQNARVVFTYHSGEAVARKLAANLPDSAALHVDLASVRNVESRIDEAAGILDGIDAFIQCAGVAITMPHTGGRVHHRMPDVDEAGWDLMMNVNVKGTFFAVRYVAGIMRGAGGNIVLTGSVDGVKPVPAPVHYGAAKSALGGMAKAMAKELGEYNIRVNVIAPGIMEEGISKFLPSGLFDEYVKHCGLKRVGKVSEIANVITWFALHNTYVTGQSIVVDGAL